MTGYANPPEHSRFKPGQSGNVKGRPKGSKNYLAMAAKEFDKPVIATENGHPRKISKKEAFVTGTINKAIKGDKKCADLAYKLMEDSDAYKERAQFDKDQQQKIDHTIIENFRQRVLEENKEIEI